MARYVRIRISFDQSEFSDFARSESMGMATTKTLVSSQIQRQLQVKDDGSTSFDLSNTFSTSVSLFMYNRDATETITVTGTTIAAATFSLVVIQEGPMIIHGIDPSVAIVFTSSSGTIEADVSFNGA